MSARPDFGLPGLSREVYQASPPAPFDTDVPVFVGCARATVDMREQFVPVTSIAEFDAAFTVPPESHLGDVVEGFFENGGRRGFVAALPSARSVGAFAEILEALRDRVDIDLVCAPDLAGWLDGQEMLLGHLALGAPQFAVVDVPFDAASDGDPPVGSQACAVFGPWVHVREDGPGATCRRCGHPGVRGVPPSGIVAGTFARVGPGVAPANIRLTGVLDVCGAAPQTPARFNELVVQPGRGVRVWGAETLAGGGIAARRLLQTIERWARVNLEAAAFEPNTVLLGLRVRRDIETLLTHLHRQGLLSGATAADAFAVICDDRNNPREARDRGELNVDIHVAVPRTIRRVHIHLVRVDARVTVDLDPP